jgi:hypothetical protein
MRHGPVATVLMLMIAPPLVLPVQARQEKVGPYGAGPRPNPSADGFGPTSVTAVPDRRPAIRDRRYNRGICRCD